MTPEQRDKHLKAIERIELAPRPEKWRLTRKLLFELKPWLATAEKEHNDACKELRLLNENKYASSKQGTMRNSMKLFGPVWTTLLKLDPELRQETSGNRNQAANIKIGKQLWEAFPEYRICRNY